ncbi:MAG TPA: MMPL family transporter [Thermoanaerobaculia bacterium]|nr:MMPL family transporter [Thermoanaerobaculia bacterium]
MSELKIRVNDLDFLPAGSPVLVADQAIRERFGSDERLIIAFEGLTRDLSDPQYRKDLAFFVQRLAQSPNIDQLLFDRLYRHRFQPQDSASEPWLLHAPDSLWIERALEVTAVTGQLAAGRSRRTVFLETPALSASGVASIERRVSEAFAGLEARRPGEYRVRLVGRYVVLNGLGHAIFDDLKHLLPWSFLIIGLLFWLIFRSWVLVTLAVFQSAVTVLLTLAIQARLGHPLSLMTALIPVLITVIGIADEIHFFGTFLSLRARHPEKPAPDLAWETLRGLFFPCTAITLTTVIGFASFWATEAPALQVFGLMAGIGLAVSWLISVTLVPVVLAVVPIRTQPRWSLESWKVPGGWLLRPEVLVVLSLVLIPGILRLRVDDGWTRNFRPDHPIVQDVRWFEKESVGLYQLDLMLERGDGRRWTEPAELAALEKVQREIDSLPEVTASVSLPDLLRDRAWELGDPAAARPPLPATRPEAERLLTTYALFNEQTFARMLLDSPETATRLIFAVASDDYRTATRVRQAVDRAVRRAFPGGQVAARVGGSAERGRVLIGSIVNNQATSVLLSLGASLIVLGFASGRWGRALRCIAANAWALLLVLGTAGWLGIDMGVASSSFLALGVGVGLDYGIHLAFHPEEAETPHAIVALRVAANVLVVSAGLAVLMLSANPTIAELGFLIVASLVASGYTSLVVFGFRRSEAAAGVPLTSPESLGSR